MRCTFAGQVSCGWSDFRARLFSPRVIRMSSVDKIQTLCRDLQGERRKILAVIVHYQRHGAHPTVAVEIEIEVTEACCGQAQLRDRCCEALRRDCGTSPSGLVPPGDCPAADIVRQCRIGSPQRRAQFKYHWQNTFPALAMLSASRVSAFKFLFGSGKFLVQSPGVAGERRPVGWRWHFRERSSPGSHGHREYNSGPRHAAARRRTQCWPPPWRHLLSSRAIKSAWMLRDHGQRPNIGAMFSMLLSSMAMTAIRSLGRSLDRRTPRS